MNILINCPSILNINNKKNKVLGGVESLTLALAQELSKRKYNITLSSICKKSIKKNNILHVPINSIKKNPKNYNFDSIISTNDASIFNYYSENKKKYFGCITNYKLKNLLEKNNFIQ